MPLSTSLYEVTNAIYETLENEKVALGIATVYFGNQNLVPEFPSVWVASSRLERQLAAPGSTHKWALGFRVMVTLVHGKIQSSEINAREEEQLSEAIEAKLHEDLKLGERVIFGMVTLREPGQIPIMDNVQRHFLRATRMTWEADSRQYF